jgi:hypothetical protein
MILRPRRQLWGLGLGLLLTGLAFAPAPVPAETKATLKKLAEARYQSSLRAYEESWIYYRQARTDPFFVYAWSRLVMSAEGDLSDRKADRMAALGAHLERMQKLEALVKKVRKIGFQRSIDVVSSDYFIREAEYWIAKGRLEDKPLIPPSIPFPFPPGG